MKFDNFFSTIDNIKYLNYKIDKNHNYELFNEIKFICNCAKKHKLDIIFGGAWGTIFYCPKLYRTIKDIDVCFREKDTYTWFNLLNDRYKYIYPKDVNPKNFFKNQYENERPVPFENINNSSLRLDIVFTDFKKIKNKIFIKSFEEFDVHYIALHKKFYNMNLIYNRQKDKDDIDFYSQFIKYEKILSNSVLELAV